MNSLFVSLALAGLLGLCHGRICPPPEVFLPCKCREDIGPFIECITNSTLDIKKIFDRASEFIDEDVVFRDLTIRGIANVEIEEGAIEHLKFVIIKIWGNPNLEWISPNAFGASRNVTTELYLRENKLSNSAPRERDIFELVNNFQNLGSVNLRLNHLTSIPSNAVQNLPFLEGFYLSNNRIRNIGSRAFAGGPGLKTIQLGNNDIPSSGLPEDAFEGISTSASVDIRHNRHLSLEQKSYQSLLDRAAQVQVGESICPIGFCIPGPYFFCDRRVHWLCDKEVVYRPKITFRCWFPSLFRNVWEYCDYRKMNSL